MAKFVCKDCGYGFESEIENRIKKCPYCNKESLGEEQDAEKIIKEVEKILD